MLPHLGVAGSVAMVGVVFLLWTPGPAALDRPHARARLRFYEGAKAEEWPRAVVWGGVEEPVEVERSWREERDGVRMARFRLALRGRFAPRRRADGARRCVADRARGAKTGVDEAAA